MQNLAPIALFVYNRPQHTERTVKFLQQNDGKLSKRAQENEFDMLLQDEIEALERLYVQIYKIG